jgi:hypothetical protein
MKTYILVLFSIIAINFSCFAQSSEKTHQLKWKISKDEVIAYQIETINLEDVKFDPSQLLSVFDDSIGEKKNKKELKEFNELLKSINDSQKNIKQVATIENKGNLLYARVFIRKDSNTNSSPKQSNFNDLMQGIQLRGLLNQNGSIYSYFLEIRQKNLLALYFQLPDRPIKIGYSWPLDIQWFTANYTFLCDSVNKTNCKKLESVYENASDTIAILNYKYSEYLSGQTEIPFNNSKRASLMTIDCSGLLEFNITKGRWEKYNLIVTSKSTGLQNASSKQLIKLTTTTLTDEEKQMLIND